MNAASAPFRQQILLVDDEEDALVELAESLENEGFVCFTATSVTFALQELTLNPDIALVITDLRMPEESGISLIKRLREHTDRQHLPVIVMSGHAEMDDVSSCSAKVTEVAVKQTKPSFSSDSASSTRASSSSSTNRICWRKGADAAFMGTTWHSRSITSVLTRCCLRLTSW